MVKRAFFIFIACLMFVQASTPVDNLHGKLISRTESNQSANTLQSIQTIASGERFTCAITDDGKVKCWGNNQVGQLGNNSQREMISVPVDVLNLGSPATAIATGWNHACALLENGKVKCWGSNQDGKLGDGTDTNRRAPVQVNGLYGVPLAIAAGDGHTCAVLNREGTNTVSCWGNNRDSQLGSGSSNAYSLTPVDVEGLGSLSGQPVALALGDEYSCALLDNGSVACWGWYMGGSYLTARSSIAANLGGGPAIIPGMESGITGLRANMGTFCGSYSGGIKCVEEYGATAQDVPGITEEPLSFAVGMGHACAVLPDAIGSKTGGLVCWGNNSAGQIGDGTHDFASLPEEVIGLSSGMINTSAGGGFSCGLLASGGVKCWGADSSGQLGDGVIFQYTRPTTVQGIKAATTGNALALGYYYSCARSSDNHIHCWGNNSYGVFGDGTTTSSWQPVQAQTSGLSSIGGIFGGYEHICAMINTTFGRFPYCWGENTWGQVGNGSHGDPVLVPSPVTLPGGTAGSITGVGVGKGHTCARMFDDDTILCWGANSSGQLGDGTTYDRDGPTPTSPRIVTDSLALGYDATCAGVKLNEDDEDNPQTGGVYCWGSNAYGKLGKGDSAGYSTKPSATDVLEGTSVGLIVAGENHFCALVGSNNPEVTIPLGIYCWGYNGEGQFGNGTTSSSNVPVYVMSLGIFYEMAAGGDNTCALAPSQFPHDGSRSAYCWGDNEFGQIGDGSTTNRTTPVKVMGLESGVVELKVGHRHACAVLKNGTIKCWGSNAYGEVGQPFYNERLTPVDVLAGLTPQIEVNYPDGKPGSVFTIIGTFFPPGLYSVSYSKDEPYEHEDLAPQAIQTDTVQTGEDGSFIFFLTTTDVEPGSYRITVGDTSTGASAIIILDESSETRQQEGGGVTFALPIGLQPPAEDDWHIFLPSVTR